MDAQVVDWPAVLMSVAEYCSGILPYCEQGEDRDWIVRVVDAILVHAITQEDMMQECRMFRRRPRRLNDATIAGAAVDTVLSMVEAATACQRES